MDLIDAEQEFLKAFSSITLFVEEPIEYRIHYDGNNITMCTMQNHPENTQYLIVDKETYDNYFSYIIINGTLKKIDINPGYSVQLVKSTQGYKTVKNHAGILLENDETYTNTEYYEFRTS
jgi:hypothetical protein